MRCRLSGYQYSEIIRSLMSVYFCGGSCIEDVTTHLMYHLSLYPTLRTCSADTILRAIKELPQDNISYTSDTGKTYDFNTADYINGLLRMHAVDEIILYTVPFISGSGRHFFKSALPEQHWTLSSLKSYPNGVCRIIYILDKKAR